MRSATMLWAAGAWLAAAMAAEGCVYDWSASVDETNPGGATSTTTAVGGAAGQGGLNGSATASGAGGSSALTSGGGQGGGGLGGSGGSSGCDYAVEFDCGAECCSLADGYCWHGHDLSDAGQDQFVCTEYPVMETCGGVSDELCEACLMQEESIVDACANPRCERDDLPGMTLGCDFGG